MPTNVVMPQMGESIAEGTIVRWIKKAGEAVERDEPLFEISTDKVDAEIPSPAAGVLAEIHVKEGETVPVDSVVAVIRQAGEVPDAAPPPAVAQAQEAGAAGAGAASRPKDRPRRDAAGPPADEDDKAELRRAKSSPLVRRIAGEHHVDISQIKGTGIGGRVTKEDILQYLDARQAPSPGAQPRPSSPSGGRPARQAPAAGPLFKPGERVEIVPMPVMRRKIAEHMVMSRRTSAHVHSVFDVDFSRIASIRETKKAEYERAGGKLTYLSFIARAAVEALGAFPLLNASLDADNIIYRKDINLGIAVALENGLIVPVIRNADEKNILGLSRAIADLAERARTKQLKPEEVQGGTFTITNPGAFGAMFGMPIINQPQVAILGVGSIEKRPVVVGEGIAIRLRAYLTLGYDHRLIDGALADQFMSHVKQQLEGFDAGAL
jgi:2-oxoglutarate dehydrogenase E2 component (dihydrolipoamide succinyltransferase)